MHLPTAGRTDAGPTIWFGLCIILSTTIGFAQSPSGPPAGAAPPGRPEVTTLEKFVVEDKKPEPFSTASVDLPRTVDDVKAYYIFNSAAIETSGANNLEEFVASRLPMHTGSQIYSNLSAASVASQVRSASTLNLRGLGVDQTLILVNGRRLPGVMGSAGGDPTQADLNGIPLSAIDRIEVLPSSASGIYGGGAVGGVINVILKRNYVGTEIKTTYNNSFDTDSARRRVEVTVGVALEGGKTHLLLSGSYTNGHSLLVQDRFGPIRNAYDRVIANSPLYPLNLPPLGATPNIYSSAANLTLKNGGVALNSRFTQIPAGHRGVALDGTGGLVANAGSFNRVFPPTAQNYVGTKTPLGATPETTAFVASARRKMTDRLEVFLDGSYQDNYTTDVMNLAFSATVPATSPANPFNQAVSVNYPDATTVNRYNRILSRRLAGGFNLKLPRHWQVQGDYAWTQTRSDYNGFGTPLLTAALASGTVDLFRDTLAYPVDFTPYRSYSQTNTKSALKDASLRSFGPVYSLPGGDVTVAATVNQRKAYTPEIYSSTVVPNSPATNSLGVNMARSQGTTSAYAEIIVPIVGAANYRPGLSLLEFQLAGRNENYSVNTVRTAAGGSSYSLTSTTPTAPVLVRSTAKYDSTNPTVGFRYKPSADAMLRVSYATAFQPPSSSALQAPRLSDTPNTTILDPRRANAPTLVYTLSGGNPGVKPETSDNWSGGIVLTPRRVPGLRVSLDFTRIEKENNISSLSAQIIVDNETEFPDRVVRAPGSAGLVGAIATVETSSLNLYRSKIEAVDLAVAYRRPTSRYGTFNVTVLGTKLNHAINQISRTIAPLDYVGLNIGFGGLKYRANGSLSWEFQRWTAGWSTTYYHSYKVSGPPHSGQTAWIVAQGAPTIGWQAYHDVFAGYRFRAPTASQRSWRSWLANTELQFGIKNVLDRVPNWAAQSSTTGNFVGAFGDLRLATYWLSLKKTF